MASNGNGANGANGDRPLRAADFVEGEAEESGDGSSESEEGGEGNGGDLDGFLVSKDDAAAEAEAAASDGSSSSGGDKVDDDLMEEDVAVLKDAGIDPGELKRKKTDGDPDGRDKKRREQSGASGSGLFDPLRELGIRDHVWDDMSDAESADSFLVDDAGPSSKRKRDDAEKYDVTEEQLQDIMDIFGDTSVLRPLDELDDGDGEADDFFPPGAEIETEEGAGEDGTPAKAAPPSSAAPGTRTPRGAPRTPGGRARETSSVVLPAAAGLEVAPLVGEDKELDPDLKDKLYETLDDHAIEKADYPERWLQDYQQRAAHGLKDWSEEEQECEARWIYMYHFWEQKDHSYEQESTEAVLRTILKWLHVQKLEPIYIVKQFAWRFVKQLYIADFWKIFAMDRQWQSIWIMFSKVRRWATQIEALPIHILAKTDPKIFETVRAEIVLRDAHDWFCANYPSQTANRRDAPSVTREQLQMAAVRECNFGEKLGLVPGSIEESSLGCFGITPTEFGENVEHGERRQLDRLKDLDNTSPSVDTVCQQHTTEADGPFPTKDLVKEGIQLFLSRLVASEPRVRKFVREKFLDMCAISTSPTDSGRPVALEAAHAFKQQYRAFHLVNRPLSSFNKGDILFLDILELVRKGFINLEYSLIDKDEKSGRVNQYKYVLLAKGESEVSEMKGKMMTYSYQKQDQTELKETLDYNDCSKLWPILENIARAHEVELRLKSAVKGDKAEKASVLFRCSAMTFGPDQLNNFMKFDPIYEALTKLFCNVQEDYIVDGEWNEMRKSILRRALRDEIYPMLWEEVQMRLISEAEEAVCSLCSDSLLRIIDVQPYKLDMEKVKQQREEEKMRTGVEDDGGSESDGEDWEWKREKANRMSGCCSVLSIVPEAGSSTCVCALINAFGEPLDMRTLFKSFYKEEPKVAMVPSHLDARYLEYIKQLEHREIFVSLITRHKPAVILLPVQDKDVSQMKDRIQEILDQRRVAIHFKVKPQILFCDPAIPRAVAYHPRIKEEGVYRDCEFPVQRLAISAARFIQDALAETLQLWHDHTDENSVLKLRLHRLQHVVRTEHLQRALMIPILETVAKVGLHVNRVRRSLHLATIVPFISGLGPRKARMFLRCIHDAVTSRAEFAARIERLLDVKPGHTSPVVENCIPFIKIAPDQRDAWDIEKISGLDRTRLAKSYAPWIESLCKQAIKFADQPDGDMGDADFLLSEPEDDGPKADKDKDCVLETIKAQKKDGSMEHVLNDLNLDDWPEWAGERDFDHDVSDLDTLFSTLRDEIQEPFADQRQEFQELEDTAAFYLMIGETEDSFTKGTIVHTVVWMDSEYKDVAGGQPLNDMKEVTVKLVPTMVNGKFRKMYKQGQAEKSGYVTGCAREFKKEEGVVARVVNFKAERGRPPLILLSVDPDQDEWGELFPITAEDSNFFVPYEGENWTAVTLGVLNSSEEQKRQALKDWVRRPRNIKHPNYTEADYDIALKEIDLVPLGNVLFRPSKRHDIIVGMLKVFGTDPNDSSVDYKEPKDCFRVFQVCEKGDKTPSARFEIAKELEVDGVVYRDFDEIIARHMDPIMEYVRQLREHPRFALNGAVSDRLEATEAIKNISREDVKMLHYCLLMHDKYPGHGLLVWTVGGKQPRAELIEVTPKGYALWGNPFDSLAYMIQWFKSKGWRNSSRLRKDFTDGWKERTSVNVDVRGLDALGDVVQSTFAGWGAQTSAGGLQTPRTAAGTPTVYGLETAAPTPGGLATPGGGGGLRTPGGFGGGLRTPNPTANPGSPGMAHLMPGARANPGTPNPMAVPSTPVGASARGLVQPFHAPGTPAELRGAAPRSVAPQTPRGAYAPGTPAALSGAPWRGTNATIPATPVGVPGTPAGAWAATGSRTPAGPPPGTPGFFGTGGQQYGGPASRTPFGPPPTPGFSSGMPMTPAMHRGQAPATPAGLTPHATHGGPATPREALAGPGTPAGLTPREALAGPGTPAGLTPREALDGPGTPAGLTPREALTGPAGLTPREALTGPGTPREARAGPGTPQPGVPGTPRGAL